MFSHFYTFQVVERIETSSFISLLLNFLVLKYQGKTVSPFETNPKTALFGVTSFLLYSFSYYILPTLSSSNNNVNLIIILNRFKFLFGSLSIASLASLLYPDSATPFIFMLSTIFSIGDLIIWISQRIRAWIREALHFQLFFMINNLFWRIFMQRRQRILPPPWP